MIEGEVAEEFYLNQSWEFLHVTTKTEEWLRFCRHVARYVAQVQISSVLENSARTIAKDVTDLVLDYLPDQNGKVRAVEYSNVIDNVLQ